MQRSSFTPRTRGVSDCSQRRWIFVPSDLPETDSLLEHPAAQRLVLALVISLAFHLAIVLLIRVAPAQVKPPRNVVIEVNLEEASRPAIKAAIAALEQKQAEASLTQTAPTQTPPAEPKPAKASKPESLPNASQEQAKSALPTLEVPLIEDPTFYPAKQLDVHPKALSPISPVYPDKAASDNVSGEVTLLLLIDETGTVRDLDVVDARPEEYFEESALNAFRNTRWATAQKDGRIVKARVLIRVRYELGVGGAKVGF